MKKILINMSVSLDGYIEGLDKDISWHRVDADFNRRALDLLRSMDTLLFGRKTFRLFEDYWPAISASPGRSKADREIARLFDGMEKVVYSKTLKQTSWKSSRIERTLDPQAILKMKRRPGAKYLGLAGGAEFLSFFLEHGLVDEVRIQIHPIVLGAGRPLFPKLKNRIGFKLSGMKKMSSGVVALTYLRE